MSYSKYKLALKYDKSRGWKWRVSYRDAEGKSRTKGFGPAYSNQRDAKRWKSLAVSEYESWVRDQDAATELAKGGITVAVAGAAYLNASRDRWQKNGKPTSTVGVAEGAVALLDEMFGDRLADELELRDLVAVRQTLADRPGVRRKEQDEPDKATAHTVNTYLTHIRRVFVYAREQGWITKATAVDLLELKPVRDGGAGREVYEPTPREVAAVLRRVKPAVAAMIRVQWRTGMRPGEVRTMRVQDLATVQGVLVYTPASHKTEHHGRARPIAVLPDAERTLRRWMDEVMPKATKGYIFTPRNSTGPYDASAYRCAVMRACRRAGIKQWSPQGLRHAFASRMRGLGGGALAKSLLGHADESTTEGYGQALMEVVAAARTATSEKQRIREENSTVAEAKT
ncbi:MAG: site-specific integrase [Planctomycetota bacterium]